MLTDKIALGFAVVWMIFGPVLVSVQAWPTIGWLVGGMLLLAVYDRATR